jgi:hypothetical protein
LLSLKVIRRTAVSKHFKMKTILSLIISILSYNIAKADCLACWEQRKVEIIFTSGDTLKGYVEWNESWLTTIPNFEKWKNKFPESLRPFYMNKPYKKDFTLTKKLIVIKNDSINEFIATKNEYQIIVDFNKIKSIRELDKNSKKLSGAGDIPVFTQTEIEILQNNPFAIIRIEGPVSDTYFLIYNHLITRENLRAINERNFEDKIDEMKQKGVIVYSISYD